MRDQLETTPITSRFIALLALNTVSGEASCSSFVGTTSPLPLARSPSKATAPTAIRPGTPLNSDALTVLDRLKPEAAPGSSLVFPVRASLSPHGREEGLDVHPLTPAKPGRPDALTSVPIRGGLLLTFARQAAGPTSSN